MAENVKPAEDKPQPGEQQSSAVAEARKPEDARAKGDGQAGNILGGYSPEIEQRPRSSGVAKSGWRH